MAEMTFHEILKEMVDGVSGAVAATVMGMDGISIQQYAGAGSGYDVETMAVEYGRVIEEIAGATEVLRLGALVDLRVSTGAGEVLIRMISPEYYIAVVLANRANIGKAGYLLRRAALKAAREIAA
jgi:predicted regulator of Ras-like GTPase activity (Roadblock/LC7/MglB family)